MLCSFHGTSFDATASTPSAAGMTLIDWHHFATTDCGAAMAYEAITATEATGSRTWTSGWNQWEIAHNFVIAVTP
jgi:hypothetical protein